MNKIVVALIASLLPLAAHAQDQAQNRDPVQIHDAVARGSNPRSGAIYLVLENTGPTACTLMAAKTDIATRAELHSSRIEGGMAKMTAIGPVVIGPGESHKFSQGGDHIMLTGLKRPLKGGEQIALTLDLGDCGLRQLSVPVNNQLTR